MAKNRRTSGQRSISRARATRRPAPTTSAAPAPARRSRLSPATTHWLRTSKIPIVIAALVLVAILVAMYFRLTEPAAGAVPLPALTSADVLFAGVAWSTPAWPRQAPIA